VANRNISRIQTQGIELAFNGETIGKQQPNIPRRRATALASYRRDARWNFHTYPQRKRSLFGWIAILAILLNALAPAVSQALEHSRGRGADGSDWIEVCSTLGTSWVRLAPDGRLLEQTDQRPAKAPTATHEGYCLYCVTHAASFGLPPGPDATAPVWPQTFDLSPPRALLTRRPVAWMAPAARAPPFAASLSFP
jgi:hypothetical protein